MLNRNRIEALIGDKIRKIQPLSGGMIAEVYRLDFEKHQSCIAKTAHGNDATLGIEGKMLMYLSIGGGGISIITLIVTLADLLKHSP